ncbi:MAG: ankyrin repeat domain-containing protein [Candidatus Symbiodolus clandestinus]
MHLVLTPKFYKEVDSAASKIVEGRTSIEPGEYENILSQFKQFISKQSDEQQIPLKEVVVAWDRLSDGSGFPSAKKQLAHLMHAFIHNKFSSIQYQSVLDQLAKSLEVCPNGIMTNVQGFLDLIEIPNFSQDDFILRKKEWCIEQFLLEFIQPEFVPYGNETHWVSKLINYLQEDFGLRIRDHELSPDETIPDAVLIDFREEAKIYLSIKLTADYFIDQLVDFFLENLEEFFKKELSLDDYDIKIGESIKNIEKAFSGSSLDAYDFIDSIETTDKFCKLKPRQEIVNKLKPLVIKNLQERGFLAMADGDETTVTSYFSTDTYLFLRGAIKAGQYALVASWLQLETADNIQEITQRKSLPFGETLLIMAAKRGHVTLVELLLNYYDTNQQVGDLKTVLEQINNDGLHALSVAIKNCHPEVVSTLLKYAKKTQIYKTILLKSSDYIDTPLINAVDLGKLQIVKILLDDAEQQGVAKEILQQVNEKGATPLLIAVDRGYHEIVKSLLALAQQQGVINLVLQQYGKKNRISALHIVAENNNIEITNTLLKYAEKAQIAKEILLGSRDCGDSPLITAIQFGNQKIVTILLETAEQQGIIKEVLQQSNESGVTPLLVAAHEGYDEIVEILLVYAKKYDITDVILKQCAQKSVTALKYAAERNHLKVVNTLLEHAVKSQILKEILLGHRNNDSTLIKAVISGNLQIVNTVLNHAKQQGIAKEILQQVNISGVAPLMLASYNGYCEILGILLDYAEQYNITDVVLQQRNHQGFTALRFAIEKNHCAVVKTLLNFAEKTQIAKEILLGSSDYGDSPLITAVEFSNQKIVTILLETAEQHNITDVMLQQRNCQGFTALRIAAENNHCAVVKTLLTFAEKTQISKEMLIPNDEPLHLQPPATTGNLEQACNSFPEEITALSNQTPTAPESLNQPELSADPRL